METNESRITGNGNPEANPRSNGGVWILIGGLLVGLAGTGYGIHAGSQAAQTRESQLSERTALQTEMTQMRQQMQQQIQVLQERLVAEESKARDVEAAAAAQAASPATVKPAPARRTVAKAPRPPVEDPRLKELEQKFSQQNQMLADQNAKLADQSARLADHNAKLADQSARLDDTRRLVGDTRTDLENRISATSQELHGSIARTSDEVALLRRRGERDYVEFDLAKSKTLSRIGPVSLALRKTDLKHKRLNYELLVDDNKMEKKNVNLLEPVYITSPEFAHPVEIVVNRIEKDRVRGYVSTPKYKRAELVSTNAQPRDQMTSRLGAVRPE